MNRAASAPWIAAQTEQVLRQQGHAWLLSGPSGLGQYELALELVRAWLCEQPSAQGACNACNSCHGIEVRTHADLFVLMPETIMLELDWPLSEKAQTEIDEKKRKASKEIRVEAMRETIEFSQRTSARGRGKAVLIYPAERMNAVTANALLKTLEEPPGAVRFVLASDAAHQLLPTIRSRCLGHSMIWPGQTDALAWLEGQGVQRTHAAVLLRAAGDRPEAALQYFRSGRTAPAWLELPKAVSRGDVSVFKDWTLAQVVDALHKLCHDALAVKMGANSRFFDLADLSGRASVDALTAWARALSGTTHTVEHPWNSGLMLEALVNQAQNALNSGHSHHP